MEENFSITNIKSKYALKYIFSFLEYKRFISLIKYNKSIHKKLNINLKNLSFNNKYITRRREIQLPNEWGMGLPTCVALQFIILFFLFFLIHYIINCVVKIKLKENYDKSNDKYHWDFFNSKIIRILSIIYYIFSFYVIYHMTDYAYGDYKNSKKVFTVLFGLIIIIQCYCEYKLIFKIYIIYSFASNGKWIILFDAIYLIVNILYLIFGDLAFKDYIDSETYERMKDFYYLVSYKDINIEEYLLDNNFPSKNEKRKFISLIANNFKIDYSQSDLDLINAINDYRFKKNLNELILDNNIPEYIIKGSTELILSLSNIIKISNIKYILKYNVNDDFVSIKTDINAMQILLQPFFNKINIIRQRNNKYITVYEDFDIQNYNAILVKDNFEDENLVFKK